MIAEGIMKFNREWFELKPIPGTDGNYMVPKDGFLNLIQETTAAKEKEYRAILVEASKNAGKSEVKVDDALLESLSQRYDPKNMTKDACRELVNELEEAGVLEEGAKGILGCMENNMVLLAYGSGIGYVTPVGFSCPSFFNGGDLLDWCARMGSIQRYDETTSSFYYDLKSLLARQLHSVLDQIGK